MSEQKKYMDIDNLRETDIDLGGGLVRRRNDLAFHPGDIIGITEKIDGSNASIQPEEGRIVCFSRRKELTFNNTLAGFFNFAQGLDPTAFADAHDLAIFGEWLRKNKITYDPEKMNQWYIYDIFDMECGRWLGRGEVMDFAQEHGLTYVHELYYGPFISWEHCRSFMNMPAYGERQEGIVVRNFTAMDDPECKYPFILKLVNQDFVETKRPKVIDPAVEAAKAEARKLMESIVTRNRIEKELLKMRDDGIIGDEVVPEDMGKIAKNLPKRIYDDCVKEEPEIVMRAGEYAGKTCASITMQIARDILLG